MNINAKNVLYGQACLYIGLLACILIRPQGLAANGGISYYGIYRETVGPYLLALLGSSYFSIRAALNLNGGVLKTLKIALVAVGVLTAGIVATPDSMGRVISDAHDTIGIALFVIQLLLSGWLTWRLKLARAAVTLTVMEFLSGLAAFFYLNPAEGFLLQSQVVFQICFGAILFYSLSHEDELAVKQASR